jgi:hypothetical protein
VRRRRAAATPPPRHRQAAAAVALSRCRNRRCSRHRAAAKQNMPHRMLSRLFEVIDLSTNPYQHYTPAAQHEEE